MNKKIIKKYKEIKREITFKIKRIENYFYKRIKAKKVRKLKSIRSAEVFNYYTKNYNEELLDFLLKTKFTDDKKILKCSEYIVYQMSKERRELVKKACLNKKVNDDMLKLYYISYIPSYKEQKELYDKFRKGLITPKSVEYRFLPVNTFMTKDINKIKEEIKNEKEKEIERLKELKEDILCQENANEQTLKLNKKL